MTEQQHITKVETEQGWSTTKLVTLVVSIAVGMVLVGFLVLPPLYTALCSVAGVEARPNSDAITRIEPGQVAERTIDVNMSTEIRDGLQVKFYAVTPRETATVGEDHANTYVLKNMTDKSLFIRPVHSVTPPMAASEFQMTKCFCFNDMELEPFAEREFEVVYCFGTDMDKRVRQAWVSYTLHAITEADLRPETVLPESLKNSSATAGDK